MIVPEIIYTFIKKHLGEKTDAAGTSTSSSLFSWVKSTYAPAQNAYTHLTSYLSSTRMAKIDSIETKVNALAGSSSSVIKSIQTVTVPANSHAFISSVNTSKSMLVLNSIQSAIVINGNGVFTDTTHNATLTIGQVKVDIGWDEDTEQMIYEYRPAVISTNVTAGLATKCQIVEFY